MPKDEDHKVDNYRVGEELLFTVFETSMVDEDKILATARLNSGQFFPHGSHKRGL